MQDDRLFQPSMLGSLELPNRVVMTTVKLGYGSPDGGVTRRHLAFYRRRAEGGVGLLTTEPLYVRSDGRELPTQMGVHGDASVPGLRGIVDEVHGAGGRVMAHINHAGRAANPALVGKGGLLSASDVPCPANQGVPRAMELREIAEIVEAFGEAARRVREAGFDALEIPFSHGYLIHQFLSPRTNHREDGYGGSLGSRLRFGIEILERVREAVGETFPIVVRMNAADYVEGGLGLNDALDVARALAEWGVDALSVTSGTMCESVAFCLYPAGTPKAHLLPMAEEIRRASEVPVIVAGRIRTPAVARQALERGQADFVGLGRPLLADPDWVKKARAGDEEGILFCPACHQGCLGSLRKGEGTGCLINPFTGREAELRMEPASEPREVMIVGGGPAGLEAAFVAATRGHRVSLFEEKEETGGQLALAARVPHKEGFADVVRELEIQAVRAGAVISQGVRITPRDILARDPDALILATGSMPLLTLIPGLESIPWIPATDILRWEREVEGDAVLVVGGGLVGLEVADFLSASGKDVTVVEIQETLGDKLDPLPRAMLLKRLEEQGVEIRTRTSVTRVAEGKVLLAGGSDEAEVSVDLVVLAVGMGPNRDLQAALAGSGLETLTIGDAREPRGVGEAILEGFEAGAAV